jgi:hypothetical protein
MQSGIAPSRANEYWKNTLIQSNVPEESSSLAKRHGIADTFATQFIPQEAHDEMSRS